MASAEERSGEVTRLLRDPAGTGARADLLPLIYDELHELARARMRTERPDHTLQATALVHEAYARLVRGGDMAWENRAHFFGAAAKAMRRILVEHARHKRSLRGGGGARRMDLDIGRVEALVDGDRELEIEALDTALRRLEATRARAAEVVDLRFFAGLSVDDTASALGVSPRTVDGDWAFARAWLYRELTREGPAA